MRVERAFAGHGALAADVQRLERVDLARIRHPHAHALLLQDGRIGDGALHAAEVQRQAGVLREIRERSSRPRRCASETRAACRRARSLARAQRVRRRPSRAPCKRRCRPARARCTPRRRRGTSSRRSRSRRALPAIVASSIANCALRAARGREPEHQECQPQALHRRDTRSLTGPNAGGAKRCCVADSYAVPTLISIGSSPWPAKNVIEIGIGCGSRVRGVPSRQHGVVVRLVLVQRVLRLVDDVRGAGRHDDARNLEERRDAVEAARRRRSGPGFSA